MELSFSAPKKLEDFFPREIKLSATDFHPDFAAKHEAAMTSENNRIRMSVFVDWSTVEVFGNNGKAVISTFVLLPTYVFMHKTCYRSQSN